MNVARDWKLHPPSAPLDLHNKDHDTAVELMTRWFFRNFERPADNTPWEDGAWVFVWGGPFDARTELEWAFNDTPEVVDAVVARLELIADLWAPNTNRIRQPARDAK